MAAGDGLISMKPTSIAYSGTSASINADGGVDFTAVTSLSLNGVFTGDYDNYLIIINVIRNSGTPGVGSSLLSQLRKSGVDDSGAYYSRQQLSASDTFINAQRTTNETSAIVSGVSIDGYSGFNIHMYGPYLSEPTVYRTVSAYSRLGSQINDYAVTHSLSESYDGITFFPAATEITGKIQVFGYEE